MNAELVKKNINELIEIKAYEQIKELILKYKSISEKDNEIATVFYLLPIYEKEKSTGMKTILDKVPDMEHLLMRYTTLKFYLRRIDFGVIGEELTEFFRYLVEAEVSPYELNIILNQCVVHKEMVLGIIRG